MTTLKRLLSIGAAVLAIGTLSVGAFADTSYQTPAEVVAGLTGRTVESVVEERASGKTYGTIANEAGVLAEYKAASLEMKKENLTEQVANGRITRERADEIIKAIEENQAVCDGSGSAGIGRSGGARFGSGGAGLGNGGRGMGGMGLRNGSCYIAN